MNVSCDLQSGLLESATVQLTDSQLRKISGDGCVTIGKASISKSKYHGFDYEVDNDVSGDVDISLSPDELRGLLSGDVKQVSDTGDGVHVSVDLDTSSLTYLEQTYRPPTAWEAGVFGGLR